MADPTASASLRRGLLALLLVFATWTYGWGIRRDLPWSLGSDEINFSLLATRVACTGNLNPGWFGHPGATFIYPYALGLHALDAMGPEGKWLSVNEELPLRMEKDPMPYLLLGRWMSVLFGIGALALVYAIGDRAFGPPVGIVGAWLALLSPLTLEHVQMIRTDGAGLFFGLLALWLCLRLLDRPGWQRQALAGLAIGAAVGTRYFLATLVVPLLLVDAFLLVRKGKANEVSFGSIAIGLAAIPLGFALVSPFALFDIPTVLGDLEHESRGSHPGADGLSPLGNVHWYFASALPSDVSMLELALMAIGVGLALVRRKAAPLVLLSFIVVFLAAVSFSALHWARWLIQILPLLALFSAWVLVELSRRVQSMGGTRVAALVLVAIVLVVSFSPAHTYVQFALRLGMPSTRDTAREWVLQNLQPGDRIAAELYTAPLQSSPIEADYRFSLTEMAGSPEDLRAAGYEFAMVSQAVYGRFFAQPDRYPSEVAFYKRLFRSGQLVKEWRPPPGGRGPVIRLYRLVS